MIPAEVVGWSTYQRSFNQIIALKKSALQFFSFSKVIRKGYFIYVCTCTWIYMCMCTHIHPSWNSVYVWMDTRTLYPACLLFNSQPSLINSHAVVSSLIALDNLIYQLWNLLFLLPTYPHHPTLACPLSLFPYSPFYGPSQIEPFFCSFSASLSLPGSLNYLPPLQAHLSFIPGALWHSVADSLLLSASFTVCLFWCHPSFKLMPLTLVTWFYFSHNLWFQVSTFTPASCVSVYFFFFLYFFLLFMSVLDFDFFATLLCCLCKNSVTVFSKKSFFFYSCISSRSRSSLRTC